MEPRDLRRGQTFLLIVMLLVGVAAMVIALSMPITFAAREAEKKRQCMENLRQISVAMEIYRADFGGRVPFVGNSTAMIWDGTRGRKVFLGVLHPEYIRTLDILFCPDHRCLTRNNPRTGQESFGKPGSLAFGSYFVRGSLQFAVPAGTASETTLASLAVQSPEGGPFDPAHYPDAVAWITDYNVSEIPGMTTHGNHGIHVLLADGKVRFLRGQFSCRTGPGDTGEMFWKPLDDRMRKGCRDSAGRTDTETAPVP